MENNTFNLINQLNEEQKSLWRIENFYIPESKNKDEEKFWKKLKTQKAKIVAELSMLTKKSFK